MATPPDPFAAVPSQRPCWCACTCAVCVCSVHACTHAHAHICSHRCGERERERADSVLACLRVVSSNDVAAVVLRVCDVTCVPPCVCVLTLACGCVIVSSRQLLELSHWIYAFARSSLYLYIPRTRKHQCNNFGMATVLQFANCVCDIPIGLPAHSPEHAPSHRITCTRALAHALTHSHLLPYIREHSHLGSVTPACVNHLVEPHRLWCVRACAINACLPSRVRA